MTDHVLRWYLLGFHSYISARHWESCIIKVPLYHATPRQQQISFLFSAQCPLRTCKCRTMQWTEERCLHHTSLFAINGFPKQHTVHLGQTVLCTRSKNCPTYIHTLGTVSWNRQTEMAAPSVMQAIPFHWIVVGTVVPLNCTAWSHTAWSYNLLVLADITTLLPKSHHCSIKFELCNRSCLKVENFHGLNEAERATEG